MKLRTTIALCAAVAIVCAAVAAQDEPVRPRTAVIASLEKIKVHTPGKDVTSPELLPSDSSHVAPDNCEEESSGNAEFHFIVDTTGMPANVQLAEPSGDNMEMNRLLMGVMLNNRFKPALMKGSPVAVGQTVKIKVDACTITGTNARGDVTHRMVPRKPAEQDFSPWPKAPAETVLYPMLRRRTPVDTMPVPTVTANPDFSEKARRDRIQGLCMVQVIVDTDGIPREPMVTKPLGYGLDEKAIAAVKRYRFQPAMKDGQPVAVILDIQMNFRLY
jgi:TonB family protein